MSALTAQDIAVKIRRRLDAPVSERLRFHALIDDGLYRLAVHKVAPSKVLRPLLLTDPTAATLTLDADGAGDLSALVTSDRILVECIQFGRIKYDAEGYDFDLRKLEESDHGALANALDVLFGKYWLEGTSLKTRGTDGKPLASAELTLAVPYWPTLAQLPESLVERLVECCIELLEENRSDYEEDGGE
jgi:hypothetical protein